MFGLLMCVVIWFRPLMHRSGAYTCFGAIFSSIVSNNKHISRESIQISEAVFVGHLGFFFLSG